MKSPKKTSYVLFMTYFLMYSNLILSLIIVRLFSHKTTNYSHELNLILFISLAIKSFCFLFF